MPAVIASTAYRSAEQLYSERYDKVKNAQLAREFKVALPVELSQQQKELLRHFVQEEFVDERMVRWCERSTSQLMASLLLNYISSLLKKY